MILCDTDILIEAFKNNPKSIQTIRNVGVENIALSAITLMELYFGALNKKELALIKNRLSGLDIIRISDEISDIAIQLIEKYSKSHKLHIPDALIAATAIRHNLKLLTYNIKDFRYIKGLDLYQDKTPIGDRLSI